MATNKHGQRLSKQDAFGHFEVSLGDALRRQAHRRETDIVAWASERFYWESGKTIALLPHQAALLRLFTGRRPDGSRWRTQLYSTVKKSGKTAMAALMTRYDAETGPGGREFYLAANDKEQATNRVFQAIRKSIELDPLAASEWRITEHELRHANGSFIRAIASDYRGEAGSNPSMTVWTELWAFEHESALRLFEELTPVPTVDSVRLVETSAGYEGQSGLLWELHERGQSGRQLSAGELSGLTGTPLGAFAEAPNEGDLVPVWVNEGAGMVMYWDEGLVARRMPWQCGSEGERYYTEQEQSLRPSQYRRLHLNHWAQSEESFIPIEWWDACREEIAELGSRKAMVIGVDGAVSGDYFAIVGVTRHEDRERSEHVAIRIWALWVPPRGGKLDFEAIYEEIEELVQRYNVVQIVYDPFQLEHFMQRLASRVWVYAMPQGGPRAIADKTLFDVIRDRKLAHCGPADIRAHLLNANAEITGDSRVRIVKRNERLKIDLAVAMSMAVERCLYLNID
jgi:phage terminase large subunit-like protein